ncbi:MAG: hypothetical protein MJ211_02195 [Bacteroidales bacterium]|nr:hypothetical protein [Bacteroidales bacterium]
MKKNCILLISLLLITFVNGCAVKDADETVEFFYKMLKCEDFETAVSLIDNDVFIQTSRNTWIESLTKIQQKNGKILNFTRKNYYSDTINNITRVELIYEVKYEDKITTEKIQLICREGKYKITYYGFE